MMKGREGPRLKGKGRKAELGLYSVVVRKH